ncbi:polysaccharide deacetylase family protein [Stappia stellulata]|uniref:polysaccharide deacetylase family protein n=1 Tax=Stappia stellulata TaxID=71235 RepID=UPI001CD7DCC4|nr:polysaccharide deacetylase family protein [Stappia stellulata]MCA1241342.1 polysaccharide deacetylase family protein [Stappia stellulata]
MTDDGFSDFRAQLEAHLDWFAERGLSVPVWWRDDDAVEPTPALDRLIAIANTHDIEVSLAVIPREATEALAERIANEPFVAVLQHGYEHRNHQDKARGEKAAEFGSRRDADEAIRLLKGGCERLTALFGPRFVPVFVPPWNRLSPQIARRLPEAGLVASSTFTQFHPRALPYLQTHIDMIKWKKDRRFIGWRSAALRFDYQLARRRTNADEPLGILSHHLAQNDACFDFLDKTFAILRAHPGARFLRAGALLAAR